MLFRLVMLIGVALLAKSVASGMGSRRVVRRVRSLARSGSKPSVDVLHALDQSSVVVIAAAIVAAVVVGVTLGSMLGLLSIALAVAVFPVRSALGRRRWLESASRELPEVFEALARSLRTGASMRWAISEVAGELNGPISAELREVDRAIAAGVAIPVALDAWAERHRLGGRAGRDRRPWSVRFVWPPALPGGSHRRGDRLGGDRLGRARLGGDRLGRARLGGDRHGGQRGAGRGDGPRSGFDRSVRLGVAALAIAAEIGGPQARSADAVAATLREQRAMAGDIAAGAAQARLSALILVAVPVVFALAQAVTNRDAARFLFGTRAGVACVIVGLGLDGIGAAWMQRLANAT